MTKLTKEERETCILWNDADDFCTIWTLSPTWERRLTRRLGPSQNPGRACWVIPKSRITVRGKARKRTSKAGSNT